MKLSKYDVCSIYRNYKSFQALGQKWCKQSKHDCGVCATTNCSEMEIQQIIKKYEVNE